MTWMSITPRVARHARKVVVANPHLPFPPGTICGYRLAATTSDSPLPLCYSVAFAILAEFLTEGLLLRHSVTQPSRWYAQGSRNVIQQRMRLRLRGCSPRKMPDPAGNHDQHGRDIARSQAISNQTNSCFSVWLCRGLTNGNPSQEWFDAFRDLRARCCARRLLTFPCPPRCIGAVLRASPTSYDCWGEPANMGNRHHDVSHHALAHTDVAMRDVVGKPDEVFSSDLHGIIDLVMR